MTAGCRTDNIVISVALAKTNVSLVYKMAQNIHQCLFLQFVDSSRLQLFHKLKKYDDQEMMYSM